MKLTAQIVAWCIVGIVTTFSFLPNTAFAQTYPNYSSTNASTALGTYLNTTTDTDVPHNLHSLMQVLFMESMSTMTCQLAGIDPLTQNHECLGADPQTGRIGYVPNRGGILGMVESGIAFTFYTPARTRDYIAYLHNEFGSNAYAATQTLTGEGFSNLQPLLSTWVAFRNVAYLLFVLAFIAIGIGIMLRIQIDPRTVMTIENQLPKIIIGLILVTFSYAIAGLMIDLMWVLTFFVINIMNVADAGKGQPFASNATNYLFQTPFFYFNNVWNTNTSTGGGWGIFALTSQVMGGVQALINNMFGPGGKNLQISAGSPNGNSCSWWNWGSFPPIDLPCLLGDLIGGVLWILLSVLAWTIGWLIILLAIIIVLIRLWIALLKAYIYIIIAIVLAPFYIIGGVIPGSSLGFGSWLKTLSANLLVYPAVVFLILLARVISDQFGNTNNAAGLFVPPLIGNPNESGDFIGAMVTFGILFVAPAVPGVINKALGNEGLGLGGAALGGLGAGAKMFTSTARNAGSAWNAYSSWSPGKKGQYEQGGWKGVLRSKFR